jgi:nucleoporin POM34
MACLPLIRRPDDISDIPLTPAQRRLLGLPPSDTPPPPGSTYVTPPRYARSRTNSPAGSPLSGSPLSGKGVSAAATGSGGRASPLQGGSPASGTPGRNNSPFSPNASPLLHKTLGGGLGTRRSGSFGATANSVFAGDESLSGIPSPSPKNGKASVGLNSRWLYEKGRGSGGNGRLFS